MTDAETDERVFAVAAPYLLRLMQVEASAMNLFSIVADLQGKGDQTPLIEINTGDEYSAALVESAFSELRLSLVQPA